MGRVTLLYAYLETLREQLKQKVEGLDYNGLSFGEKQAAQALLESDEVRFIVRGGRTIVKSHRQSVLLKLLTMGAHA
jgi:hypothetical protein